MQAEALENLRGWVKPGDTLFTVLRHTSTSRMKRVIQVIKINGNIVLDSGRIDCDVRYLGYNIALACGMRYDKKREGVVANGCGMDMGENIVMELGRALFPEGGPMELSSRRNAPEWKDKTVEPYGGYLLYHRSL